MDMLCAVPIEKRTTIRSLSVALGMTHSTVYRLIKRGRLRALTNSIKPSLKAINKRNIIEYILSHVIPSNVESKPKFSAMYNVIHMDVKWFYMSNETQSNYLFPWEEELYRVVQSMFMGVVARPIMDANGEVVWD